MIVTAVWSSCFVIVFLQKPDVQVEEFQQTVTEKFFLI